MCGIFFCARCIDGKPSDDGSGSNLNTSDLSQGLQLANSARGPDAQKVTKTFLDRVEVKSNDVDRRPDGLDDTYKSGLALEFFASELRLRGDTPIVQPHERDGNMFCFNGEIFSGMEVLAHENDGVKLFNAISETQTTEELTDLLGEIEGPYAFVYHKTVSQQLFFARDPLGRRSLLIHEPTHENPHFLLASVSAGSDTRYEFTEVPTHSIYCLDLRRLRNATHMATEFHACLTALPRTRDKLELPYAEPCKVNTSIPPDLPSQVRSLDVIPDTYTQAVDDLIMHLERSVMLRVQNIPRVSVVKGQARVAVLFSGGIDSTVLTLLAHKHIPLDEPIDLLNVAFENPRKIQSAAESQLSKQQKRARKQKTDTSGPTVRPSYMVPDRVSGLQELEELKLLCPGRRWNFVEVNVPYEECSSARPIVEALMLPAETVMDQSLGLALYFASRGIGQTRSTPDSEPEPYTSPARVLLNGLGSDELLGGYGRHRTAYSSNGWSAVIDELQLEIDRLPTRNLGRDDRVISSHGKEARHPFLSLDVVSFLAKLPVHIKMDPRLDVGLGDKLLLRLAARKLGLKEASERKKRAMQFGSHSARMEPDS